MAQSLTSLCKGIEVYLNEEQRPIRRGDTYNIEIPENKFRTFKKLSSPEQLGPFQPIWHKSSLGARDSNEMKCQTSFHGEVIMNYRNTLTKYSYSTLLNQCR